VIDASQRTLQAWLRRVEARPLPWLAAAGVLLAVQVSPLWYATPDGAAYLSIARRIAAGGPLARFGDAQLGFPIGYPLLISPAFLIGARPFAPLSVLQWLLAVVFLLGVYRWARSQVGSAAVWITGLVMVNVNVWILYRRTLSEAAFLAVAIWTVNLLNRVLDTTAAAPGAAAAGHPRAQASLLGAGALLILLTAIREAGVLFGGGFALAVLARAPRGARRWKAAALPLLVTAVAIVVAAAMVRPERIAAAVPAFAGHLAGYADVGDAVGGSFSARLHLRTTEIGQLLMPGMFSTYGRGWVDINTLVYVPLLLVVASGWWSLIRRGGDVFAYTAPLYVGLHLAWPYAAGTRYMLPLLPLWFACLWCAAAPLRARRRALFAVLLIAHLGVAVGYWLAIDRPAARACARQWPAVEQLATHLRADARPVLAVDVPGCVVLMLELTLDRPVRQSDARAVADASVEWIVSSGRTAAAVGFVPVAAAGAYTLLRRAG
jgi:hypothetical protein